MPFGSETGRRTQGSAGAPDGRSAPGSPVPISRGSIRRTTTVDARPDGTWRAGTLVDARGRDLIADGGGHIREHATHRFRARVDKDGTLRDADDATGGGRLPAELVGIDSRRGFRRALTAHFGPVGGAGLQAALLDDLPGMRIISGYAQLQQRAPARPADRRPSPVIGVCAGWAADGTAATSGEALPGMLTSRPPAPDLGGGDERVWHADPPPPRAGMRRRRLIEVTPDTVTGVYGYFRDTYCRPDGIEVVVHEYEITATVAAGVGDLPVVRELTARPGALPFPECPAAAATAVSLHGVPLAEIEPEVRRRLVGPHGCTHLNDLLRTLRLVEPMTALFRATRGEPNQ
ncbi:DUF2889 domain-containing protein [Streptomyces prunicolor]|uniref:DUF2889 domain-containing protein n=1 Tax=Streptomyces prunicolor TaxID=67348 RepID=UPI000376C975|nr:DUF2889 domain-containing protein [Streptomyces prunicolor]